MRRIATLALAGALLLGAGCADPATGEEDLAFLAAADEVADPVLDAILAVPGVTVVGEQAAPVGYRYFALTFTQPVDHFRPWKGTFEQRVGLLHRDATRPMVLFNTGYMLGYGAFRSEPTRLVDGNQIGVEQRYFGESVPSQTDWSKLTIFQSAADHHRVVKAFKPLYAAPWLSTGGSKGGMTSVYHHRFFPDDVAGTIPYVAPHDSLDWEDSRFDRFLASVGDDPACNEGLRRVQREALERRDEMMALAAAYAAELGATYGTYLDAEQAFEFMVIEMPFYFWQYGAQDNCTLVPPPGASAEELFAFYDLIAGVYGYTDQGVEPFVPYYVHSATEIGWGSLDERPLADLLQRGGEWLPRAFVPEGIPLRYNHVAMLDIDLWVRLFGRRMLFVYGEIDPWSAEPFEIGPGTKDSYVYTVPGGNHSARISQLPQAERDAATNTLRGWAGLPPLEPPPAAAQKKGAVDHLAPGPYDLDPMLTIRPRL